MKDPLVSVKMVTYNHAPYIARAIEGVLQQKVSFPIELVIGEDCSTDGTREIVFEYQKKYPDIIRVFTSDHNVGASQNYKRIRKPCRGRYIAFCEGDDYWHHPLKLQKQVDYLERHPECGLVYSSYDIYHVKSRKKITDFIKYRKWVIPKNPGISDFVEAKSVLGLAILTCTVTLRRSIYDQILESDPYLYSGHFLMGDTQLWAEMANLIRVHYIPESLATHIITEESATRSKDKKKMLRFTVSCCELMLYLCNKYKLPSSMRNVHEVDWCDSSLRLAFHSRNAKLADEVRSKKKAFTWEEWLRYFGAKYLVMYHFCRLIALFPVLFRKRHNQWT